MVLINMSQLKWLYLLYTVILYGYNCSSSDIKEHVNDQKNVRSSVDVQIKDENKRQDSEESEHIHQKLNSKEHVDLNHKYDNQVDFERKKPIDLPKEQESNFKEQGIEILDDSSGKGIAPQVDSQNKQSSDTATPIPEASLKNEDSDTSAQDLEIIGTLDQNDGLNNGDLDKLKAENLDVGFKSSDIPEPKVVVDGIVNEQAPAGTPTVHVPNTQVTDAPDDLRDPLPEVTDNDEDSEGSMEFDIQASSKIPGSTDEHVTDPNGRNDGSISELEEEDIPLIQTEDMPSFDEWKEKMLKEQVEQEKNTVLEGTVVTNLDKNTNKKSNKNRPNYAASICGAKLLTSNSEAQNPSFILSENKDMYMIQPCNVKKWFVVELCEPVQVDYLELGNQELFSSLPERFSVYYSDRYPVNQWKLLGTFNARDERTIQTFHTQHDMFSKFLKVEILSYYGKEHYCPLSVLRVYGLDLHQDEAEEDPPSDLSAEEGERQVDGDEVHVQEDDKPKNLFNSAKDTVMSLVKTVLNGNDAVGSDKAHDSSVDADMNDLVQLNNNVTNNNQTQGNVTSETTFAGPDTPEAKTDGKTKPCEIFPADQPVAPDARTSADRSENEKPLVILIERPNIPLCEYIKRCDFCISELSKRQSMWDKSSVCGYYRIMVYVYPTCCKQEDKNKPATSLKCTDNTTIKNKVVDTKHTIDREIIPSKNTGSEKEIEVKDKVKDTESKASKTANKNGGSDGRSDTEKSCENSKAVVVDDKHTGGSKKDSQTTKSTKNEGKPSEEEVVEIQPSGSAIGDKVTVDKSNKASKLTSPHSDQEDSVQPVDRQSMGSKPATIDLNTDTDNSDLPESSTKTDEAIKYMSESNSNLSSQGTTNTGTPKHGPEIVQVRPSEKDGGSAEEINVIQGQGHSSSDSNEKSSIGELDSTNVPPQENSNPSSSEAEKDKKDEKEKDVAKVNNATNQNHPATDDTGSSNAGEQEVVKRSETIVSENSAESESDKQKGDKQGEALESEGDRIIYAEEAIPADEIGNDQLMPADGDISIQKHRSQMKETTYMKLKNKIRELEINLTLSSRYLEELSKNYKQQMEDMYKSLNKTIQKLTNTSKTAETRDLRQQDRISALERRLEGLTTYTVNLTSRLEGVHSEVIERHLYILLIECTVFMVIMGWCLARQKHVYKERLRTVSNSYFNVTSPPSVTSVTPGKGHRRGVSMDMNTPTRERGMSSTPVTSMSPTKSHHKGGWEDTDSVAGVTIKKSGSENDIRVIEPNMEMFACPSNSKTAEPHRKRKKKKNGGSIDANLESTHVRPHEMIFGVQSNIPSGQVLNTGQRSLNSFVEISPRRHSSANDLAKYSKRYPMTKNSQSNYSTGNSEGKTQNRCSSNERAKDSRENSQSRNSSKERKGNNQSKPSSIHDTTRVFPSRNHSSGNDYKSHISKNKYAVLQEITPLKPKSQRLIEDQSEILNSKRNPKRNLESNYPSQNVNHSTQHVDRDCHNSNLNNSIPDDSSRQNVTVRLHVITGNKDECSIEKPGNIPISSDLSCSSQDGQVRNQTLDIINPDLVHSKINGTNEGNTWLRCFPTKCK